MNIVFGKDYIHRHSSSYSLIFQSGQIAGNFAEYFIPGSGITRGKHLETWKLSYGFANLDLL